MSTPDAAGARLPKQYERRFHGEDTSRERVWRVLIDSYFSRYLDGVESVLDVGCGWGHFIDQVPVAERHAIDLNPAVADRLSPEVQLYTQAANDPWPLADESLDLVFTSNFLEHLPGPEAVMDTLAEAHRCLRPGGRIICMGPNIRVVNGTYWDFFDHVVALTERSMAEALELSGFETDSAIARFVPYTMVGKPPAPPALVRLYLRCRPVWRLMGGQFLVVAHRPAT